MGPSVDVSFEAESWYTAPRTQKSTKFVQMMGWLGEAKVSYSLRHQGIQLIFAYSWARPTVLVAVKVKERCFYYAWPFSIGVGGGNI